MFNFDTTSAMLQESIDRQFKIDEERNKLEAKQLEQVAQQAEYMRAQNANLMELLSGPLLGKK